MLKSQRLKFLGLIGVMVLLTLVIAGCGSTGASGADNSNGNLSQQVANLQKFADVQQKSVNPGLGTVMIEYGNRMNKIWWASHANNWPLVKYEIDEMKEIQETGEVTRPNFAPSLKAFEGKYLDTLDKAADAKNVASFETAYSNAIQGCNECHRLTTSKNVPGGYGFIKVQIPKSDTTGGLEDYAGQV